jgi:hypothetical protein
MVHSPYGAITFSFLPTLQTGCGDHSLLSGGYCVPLVPCGSLCSFYHNTSIWIIIHCVYLSYKSFHSTVFHAQIFIF